MICPAASWKAVVEFFLNPRTVLPTPNCAMKSNSPAFGDWGWRGLWRLRWNSGFHEKLGEIGIERNRAWATVGDKRLQKATDCDD